MNKTCTFSVCRATWQRQVRWRIRGHAQLSLQLHPRPPACEASRVHPTANLEHERWLAELDYPIDADGVKSIRYDVYLLFWRVRLPSALLRSNGRLQIIRNRCVVFRTIHMNSGDMPGAWNLLHSYTQKDHSYLQGHRRWKQTRSSTHTMRKSSPAQQQHQRPASWTRRPATARMCRWRTHPRCLLHFLSLERDG